jgi:DNA-binding Xre family transcriptional regulator
MADLYTVHVIKPESLGRIINDYLQVNGMSTEDLADNLGISRPTLLKLRRGEEVRMTLTDYQEICDYFFI